MSADNWTVCPKCLSKFATEVSNWKKKMEESYGKIPIEEFNDLQKKVAIYQHALQNGMKDAVMTDIEDETDTLREDYEIGIRDDVFEVSYSASCDKCGFRYNHKFTDEIKI